MIVVPRYAIDAAKDVARDTVTKALAGMFGLIERDLERRQSAAFAHERAIFHREMARTLPLVIRVGVGWRVRRQLRLANRWAAKARARDGALAIVLGLGDIT
jgi:hypothetical protein